MKPSDDKQIPSSFDYGHGLVIVELLSDTLISFPGLGLS